MQCHFRPHTGISPYVGAGLAVAWFYDTRPARLTVDTFGVDTAVGPTVQEGVDYNIAGHWFLNADLKQMLLNTRARTSLDPTLIGMGIGYRC